MTFVNVQVPLEELPRFDAVEFHGLDPRYPGVVLWIALAFIVPIAIAATILVFGVLVPRAGLPVLGAIANYAAGICFLAFLAWYSHKAASVIGYAVRDHDVIVRSGVFWRKETVQPIKRIQHIEQHQGPIDKRYGFYELKLFSAGTGHFTFQIPGLDAAAAAAIKQHILEAQLDGDD